MPKVMKLSDVSMETMKNTSTPVLAIVARMGVTEIEGRTSENSETLAALVRGYISELERRVSPRRSRRG